MNPNDCCCVFQGNYDSYLQTRSELEENQMKRHRWEQDQIAHMKVTHGLPLMFSCFFLGKNEGHLGVATVPLMSQYYETSPVHSGPALTFNDSGLDKSSIQTPGTTIKTCRATRF